MSVLSLARTLQCTAVCAIAMSGLGLASAQNAAPKIPDFTGTYSQNTSIYLPPARGGIGPVMDHPDYPHQKNSPKTGLLVREWVGDSTNPNVKPHVAAEIERMNKVELAGQVNLAPYQVCKPVGVPLILTLRENMQILQQPDLVTIMFQRDQQIRHVRMNVPHSKDIKPSWYGESVGHYEGDTLVVDTIGLNGKSPVDRYGSFSSPELHVVERYHLVDNGQTLQVDFTVSDPKNFNQPWSATQKFRRTPGPFEEVVCAENNRDAFTGVEYADQPIDNTPDF